MFSTPPEVKTAEEAAAIRQPLPVCARILLVTSAFHMRRAQRPFERQGFRCCCSLWTFRFAAAVYRSG